MSVSARRRTRGSSSSSGSSRRRSTLTISTSWRSASAEAVLNVVRMVPPTEYAFAMRKRIFTTAAATLTTPTTLPPALATGGPIFIIGCPGSGTGLLRLALNRHERIAVAPETGFMRAERASKFIPFWPFGGRWYRRLGLTEEELDVAPARVLRGALPRLRRARGQAALGREHAVARLARGRAGAAVPGRGVRGRGAPSRGERRVERAPARPELRRGRRRLRADHHGARPPGRRARRSLSRSCATRTSSWHPSRPCASCSAGSARRWADGRPRSTPRASTPTRVSRWTRSVGEPRQARLERRLGPLAAFLGYTLDDPHALAPLGAEGRLLRGAEVAGAAGRVPRPRRRHAAGRAARPSGSTARARSSCTPSPRRPSPRRPRCRRAPRACAAWRGRSCAGCRGPRAAR